MQGVRLGWMAESLISKTRSAKSYYEMTFQFGQKHKHHTVKFDHLCNEMKYVCVQMTGLVQRCVIIQRDENGFGLTVSGDNPVFVQLVKEGK